MIELDQWSPRPWPTHEPLYGDHITVRGWNGAAHGEQLWQAFGRTKTNQLLYHFGWPTMATAADLTEQLQSRNDDKSFVTCVFEDKETGTALGMASYMRIDQTNGVIEVGAVAHGTGLARTIAATEAHYLMAKRALKTWEYRRYEWKLNSTNQPSHTAAQRFGFTYEGTFRQAEVKPYGNRDTAWYSMLDREWPQIKMAFENWLKPDNFLADGTQITPLSTLTARQLPCANMVLRRADRSMAKTATAFQAAAYERTRQTIGAAPIPTQWNYKQVLDECEAWYACDEAGWTALLILRPANDHMVLESIATRADIKGMASPLMEIALQRARAYRYNSIKLITNAKNSAAGWYEALGFAIYEREEKQDRTILHMRKAV
ncbi:MAG: GNAT family N-acetyltransferase [Ahrensia sp.]